MQIAEELVKLNTALKANIATVDLNAIVNTGSGLTEDYEGEVSAFGYIETGFKLTNDQIIRDDKGAELLKVPTGSNAISLALSFKDGQTIALTTLRRSNKSRIGSKSAKAMTGVDFEALIGKSIKLDSVTKDASTAVMTNVQRNGESVREERVYKAYSFSVK